MSANKEQNGTRCPQAHEPARIVLATLNARYSHPSFGLRYLWANMGEWQEQTAMLEFDIGHNPADVAEAILARDPAVVGLGVYIWNVTLLTETAAILKRVRPDGILVLGGPEVWYEQAPQRICALADYVISGEADEAFPALCRQVLSGVPPLEKYIVAPPPDTAALRLPYDLYTEEDVRHRVIYVEASRGCPFTCEFCLSSLDEHLNRFPLETLLPAFQDLLDRGVRSFKFVDRTFNLSIPFSLKILTFFLERYTPGLFLHFEMIPDRLPEALREVLRAFPRGVLQFEVGIQTFNEDVAARIRRRQHYGRSEANIRWLLQETGAHIHADLIAGLPGEDWDSLADGFDRLLALGPQEIQLNPLKRLRGTPIIQHEDAWGLVFNPDPPYDILQTSTIDFRTMQTLRRFCRYWNVFGNSGRFIRTLPMIWSGESSPFRSLWAFFDWVYRETGRTHHLALELLAERCWRYLVDQQGREPETVAAALIEDVLRDTARDLPKFLRPFAPERARHTPRPKRETGGSGLSRQERHRAHADSEERTRHAV